MTAVIVEKFAISFGRGEKQCLLEHEEKVQPQNTQENNRLFVCNTTLVPKEYLFSDYYEHVAL